MKEEPLISVIISTYGRPHLVGRAIESVRQQTYRSLEIVVVDDASPDNTGDMVRRVADRRIRYIRHERNRGLAAATRNTGIRAARGQFVAFLDDDDEWLLNKLERQMLAIRGHGAVLCAAVVNGVWIKRHGQLTVTLEDLRRGNPFDPSGLLVRAEVQSQVMFDEQLRFGEDWDVFIRIARLCSVGYVPDPLLRYSDGSHDRVTNEAKNQGPEELEKRTAILYKHRDFFGTYWLRFHMAATLLSYFWHRKAKLWQLAYAVRRCGVMPVAVVLAGKITQLCRRRIPLGRLMSRVSRIAIFERH